MWQWDKFAELLAYDQVTTVAFHQFDFGTDYLKPTRLLLAHVKELHKAFCVGAPTFDEQGYYTGPLVQRAAARQLVGGTGSGFATTGTEQWPSAFCKWVSSTILQQFFDTHHPDLACEGEPQEQLNSVRIGRKQQRITPSHNLMETRQLGGMEPLDNASNQARSAAFTMAPAYPRWAAGM